MYHLLDYFSKDVEIFGSSTVFVASFFEKLQTVFKRNYANGSSRSSTYTDETVGRIAKEVYYNLWPKPMTGRKGSRFLPSFPVWPERQFIITKWRKNTSGLFHFSVLRGGIWVIGVYLRMYLLWKSVPNRYTQRRIFHVECSIVLLAYGGLAATESRHVLWWWGPVHV